MEKRHPNHPGKLSADQNAEADARSRGEINARARALKLLLERKLPLMVGGAYAFARYTGIYRDTKDLDLYLRKPDALVALEILAKQGWRTERTDETWIYKTYRGPWFVDLLFSSGNGMSVVDDDWFRHAVPGEVFEQSTLLIPAEEMIWSKACWEAISEALKLEAALGQLDTPKKVVIMHYSPIGTTTEGELPEVRPFLGTSRLAGPINRFGAHAVFHGHSHNGSLRGTTDKGVPVYNVAMPLLKRHTPEQRFALVEI